MRDPNRIKPTLEAIRIEWEKWPDLRLMQLFGNALGVGDHYHVEDDKLLERIADCYSPPVTETQSEG